MSRFNLKLILHVQGILLAFNAAFMLIAMGVSGYYKDGITLSLLWAALLTMFVGLALIFITRKHIKVLTKRDGYLIVSLGWILLSFSGALPYMFSEVLPSLTNAFFETMSGYTTTGATIINDIEAVPKGLLFWRSVTHWIGGMGIIVMAVAIFPLLGIGGMQLFSAEAPGPGTDKLSPRIADTAKRLWFIYMILTFAQTIFLRVAGMGWFDSVNHAMSTMSTGGFSTKNASVAYWNDNPAIQYIIIFFMFVAGINFILSYFALKGKFSKLFKDEEFRWYALFLIGFSLIATFIIYFQVDMTAESSMHPMVLGELESALRHSLFQVISIITTTGFITADYTAWTPFLTIMFFGLFFLGGCAGSTSGNIKVVRHMVMIKNGIQEFKRAIHPNAVLPVRYNDKAISYKITFNILGFFILYMLVFIIGAAGLATLGLDFETSLGGAAASLGNIGPAFGVLHPLTNFDALTPFGRWWCAILMLIGRLELFTVLILITPFFWRNH